MKRIVWSQTARREIERLNDWYAESDPDLPLTLTLRVEGELAKLLDFPKIGSALPDSNDRKWRARRTPYLIFYRAQRDGIRILKVRHARSDWRQLG